MSEVESAGIEFRTIGKIPAEPRKWEETDEDVSVKAVTRQLAEAQKQSLKEGWRDKAIHGQWRIQGGFQGFH